MSNELIIEYLEGLTVGDKLYVKGEIKNHRLLILPLPM